MLSLVSPMPRNSPSASAAMCLQLLLLLCTGLLVNVESRGVIAVLQKASKLPQLQIRNKFLDEAFYQEGRENDFDVVIFCEKYVKQEYQEQLMKSSKLPLTFVFVDSQMRGSEKHYVKMMKQPSSKRNMDTLCPANAGSNYFSFGYKAMCQFWFTDFQDYVKDYDWVLRIDDDCHLLKSNVPSSPSSLASLFPLPEHVPFAPAMWVGGEACSPKGTVTGLLNFTQNFVTAHNLTSKQGGPKNISAYLYIPGDSHDAATGAAATGGVPSACTMLSPYTNVFYVNLKWLRKATTVQTYMQEVKASGCIFNNRWGDLELWGSIQLLLEDPVFYTIPLPYVHGSHHCTCDPYSLLSGKNKNNKGVCGVSQERMEHQFGAVGAAPLSFQLLPLPSPPTAHV